ncbi:MAG: hypothetical protein A2145_00915 [candidate division Zixibacteria bacterium RBG_16_40_9]|nr:MAG: hypothetical protein A2145_00915 [candidate division Zixibacteria bacterium RBG_16_40_9]
MRSKGLIKLSSCLALLLLATAVWADQDPNDPGLADTLGFSTPAIYYPLGYGLTGVVIGIRFFNDNQVSAIVCPFLMGGPVTYDSVSFSGSRVDYLQYTTSNYNFLQSKLLIGAVPVEEALIPPGSGSLCNIYFTLNDTVGPITLDTTFFEPSNHLSFVTGEPPVDYVPRFTAGVFPILVYLPGDATGDRKVDLADLIFLVNYVFKGGPAPLIVVAGDANGDCKTDLGDIIFLVNYVFKGGTTPLPGCVP